MRASRLKVAMLGGALALTALHPRRASAQVLGNMQLNQDVGAYNDFTPPHGGGLSTPVTDSLVPFQSNASANDGTGAYVTARYNISDNGSVASLSIGATGLVTANGNSFGEGTNRNSNTTFSLLETSAYTATITSTGQATAEFYINEGYLEQFSIGAGLSFPTATASGVMAAGSLDFFDEWGLTTYNDAPQPANESGTYSLTLTFTAIPEPSCAMLLAMPAVLSLRRRRRDGRKPDDGQHCR